MRLRAADRREQLIVERAQHLGLGLEAHVADFIEEERAAVGALERAALLGRAAGLRAVAIAEQLGLDVVFGNGGAVELDEDAIAAQALGVDGAGDEFLAGARFAVDEHAAVGGRHEPDLLAQRFDRHAVAGEDRADAELALEFEILVAQAARFDGVLEDDEGAVERERLFEKVVCAELGGFDRGFDGAVAADDDDFRTLLGVELAHVRKHVEAVAIGQPDVEQHDVVGRVLDEHQGFGRGGGGGHARSPLRVRISSSEERISASSSTTRT